jgi:hypothetical protein
MAIVPGNIGLPWTNALHKLWCYELQLSFLHKIGVENILQDPKFIREGSDIKANPDSDPNPNNYRAIS